MLLDPLCSDQLLEDIVSGGFFEIQLLEDNDLFAESEQVVWIVVGVLLSAAELLPLEPSSQFQGSK